MKTEKYILIDGDDFKVGKDVQYEDVFVAISRIFAFFVMQSKAKTREEKRKCLNECVDVVKESSECLLDSIEADKREP